MFIILKQDWELFDGSQKGKKATIHAGRHEVERITNPFGHKASWLVLKGAQIGATEGFFLDWQGSEWGDFEIIIID